MAAITLTPSACTVSSGWTTLSYYGNSSGTRQLIFTIPYNEELAQAGVEISGITASYCARNSAGATKQLLFGLKSGTDVDPDEWTVKGESFTACKKSDGSTLVYTSGTYSMDVGTFGETIVEAFQSGGALYLGVIQPTIYRSIQVHTAVEYWTLTIEYEQSGNIPTSEPEVATLGETAITTAIARTIDGSTTVLRYSVNGTRIDEVDLGTDTEYTWTPPESCGDYFPDSTAGALIIAADTYVSGECLGTIENEISLQLPDDAAPTAEWEIENSGYYVQSVSDYGFALTLDCIANCGASIDEDATALTIEDTTYTGTSFTHTFAASGTVTATITVTDTRGLYTTYALDFDVLAWSAPQIGSFSIARVYDDGTEAIDGTYAMAAISASASSLIPDDIFAEECNAMTVQVFYREITDDSDGDWIETDAVTMDALSGTWSFMLASGGEALGGGDPFDDMTGYNFKAVVSDIFASATALDDMPTKEQLWDIDESTGKMGFGGDAPEEDEDASYRFHGAVDIAGSATIEEIPFGWHAGDSFELSTRMIFAAFLSGSTKVLCVGIPLGVPVYADSFSVSGGFIARGVDGYLNSASSGIDLSDSALTVDCYIPNARAGLIYVRIERSSAFTNATNNTPVALEFTAGTAITFA